MWSNETVMAITKMWEDWAGDMRQFPLVLREQSRPVMLDISRPAAQWGSTQARTRKSGGGCRHIIHSLFVLGGPAPVKYPQEVQPLPPDSCSLLALGEGLQEPGLDLHIHIHILEGTLHRM